MNKSKIVFILLFSAIQCFTLDAQVTREETKNQIIEQRIELIAQSLEEEEIDFTTLFDDLLYYFDNPINLNFTNREELEQLYLLNTFQIQNLLAYVNKNRGMASIYELQIIDGFDIQTIYTILPFIQVVDVVKPQKITFQRMFKYGKNELITRHARILEEMEGFAPIDDEVLAANPNRRYLGSPDRLYFRYRYTYSDRISIGITGDKDAGEEFFRGSQPNGFDFYSAHFMYRGKGFLRAVVLGDYQIEVGQGLCMWSGFGFRKSADALNVKRKARVLKPYTASDENLFMRGAAVTFGYKELTLTPFLSRKGVDANIQINDNDSLDDETPIFSSLQRTGFHRTPNELRNKNSITETYYGANLNYNFSSARVGANIVRSEYEGVFQRNLQLYNKFDFSNNTNMNMSVYYDWLIRNFNFFGEAARSENGGRALLSGALINLDPRVNMSVIYRNYERNYQNLYANAFGESSRNANEEGIYIGISALPIRKVSLFAYYDQFRFPWLRFLTDAPSHGVDYLVQATYSVNRYVDFLVRYRREVKSRNTRNEVESIRYVEDESREYLRAEITYRINRSLKLRNRIEFSQYQLGDLETEQGFLIFQDIMYDSQKWPLSIRARYAMFDMGSYNARIYAYEHDVRYFFSVPAYYNRGTRSYILINYKFSRRFMLSFRVAQFYFNNVYEIGSGLNKINTNTRTEIKTQAIFKF